jgi:hypothetical protein
MHRLALGSGVDAADPQGMSRLELLAGGPLPVAYALPTLTSAALGQISVLGGERMAIDAHLFGRVECRRAARSELIFSRRDHSEMVEVDASPSVTSEVIELHPSGDGAIGSRPNPNMTGPGLSSGGELGVTPMIEALGPEVACSDRIDFVAVPEASPVITDDQVHDQRITVDIPSGVVLATPAFAVSRGEAVLDQADGHGMTVEHDYKIGGERP